MTPMKRDLPGATPAPPETAGAGVSSPVLVHPIPRVPEDLPGPELSPNAKSILEGRYLLRDENRNVIESPRQLFWRVAWSVAQAERRWGADEEKVLFWAREFYTLMARCRVMPNSPTLMNAGTRRGLLSACFVLPIRDVLTEGPASIYGTLTDMATIHHSGGGTGFDFSAMRPESDVVQGSGGIASGPISFLSLYDKSTEEVKQGGKRRGANMAILRCDHPDVVRFITCKDPANKNISNFNISVAVTDAFMEALERDGEWSAINPRTGKRDKFAVFEETPDGWLWKKAESVKARWLWGLMVEHAWRTGDPGLLFVDRANRPPCNAFAGMEDPRFRIAATNPCGEQPLLPYESCNLAHIHLGKFTGTGTMDWDALKATVQTLTRFLDDVVEVNRYPIPAIDEVSRASRRIGLGVMGFTDALVTLGIPYDSERSRNLAQQLQEFVTYHTLWASSDLAKDRGRFPWWEKSVFARGFSFAEHFPEGRTDWKALDRKVAQDGLANSNVTTVAPTGTTAEIAGCEGQGCEPFFSLAYRRVTPQFNLLHINPAFRKAVEGLPGEKQILEEIERVGILSAMRPETLALIPDKARRLFATANEISLEGHVKMLAAWTRYVTSSISKTVNLPNSATPEDVDRAYRLAWETGCNSITIFRDGCKSVQVLYHGTQPGVVQQDGEEVTIASEHFGRVKMVDRPKNVVGTTYEIEAFPNRNLYVTVNDVTGKPFEVFCRLGDSGTDEDAAMQAVGKLITGLLRAGVSLTVAIKMLRGIKTQEHWLPAEDNRFMDSDNNPIRKVHSPYHALALLLEYHLQRQDEEEGTPGAPQGPQVVTRVQRSTKGGCPACGAPVTLQGGCQRCSSLICDWKGPCG
ncbi:MAG: adenosylcobalamin-dependent ribonucleoside-diphosphate reductase [Euryarchaeota archaeon]|nr:adenosylcobalamin-dependent ribonucleoside-diphosphate reductase [Euryarchaeota archaeon]